MPVLSRAAFKLPVELLAVIDPGALLTSVERARHFDNLAEQRSRKSKEYLERIAERFAGSRVKRSVEQGSAAEVIIEKAAADKSTLVAMTTHGRSGLNRWLLGSVAEKVLRGNYESIAIRQSRPRGQSRRGSNAKIIVVPLDGSELAEARAAHRYRNRQETRYRSFLVSSLQQSL